MERPQWAEQRPENWWAASQAAIRGVLAAAGAKGSDVRGIGLSGQMHGLTLLDEADNVVRPALIWCDQRSQAQVDWINRKVGKQKVLDCIANPVLTGFTLPKLLWVRDNEPRSFERVRKVLLPKDYVRFRLTGEYASDVSDASGTAMFDVVNRRWSNELVEAVGLDRSILPYVFESQDISGRVTAAVAKATGLDAGTPVVGGGGDQASSAVGNGIVESGIVSCTIGTSGVVFAHTDEPAYDPQGRVHTFCHAVRGAWHVMGVTQGAGLSLQWFRNQLAPGMDYDALTAEAAKTSCCSQGLFWLPYLMGERTPHLDPAARGGWIGMTARHTRADLIRSVLEGVSFSQKDCLDIIETMGVPVRSARLSGGGARSAFWRQMLADVFGKPVVTLETQEGSAYGAAILALVGTGVFDSVTEACHAVVREVETVCPRPHESQLYARGHEVYTSLYPTLKPIYRLIQNVSA
jgi:xylulokinase